MKRSTVGQRCMLVTGSFSSEANHAGTSRLRVEAVVGLIGKALRYGIQVVSPTSCLKGESICPFTSEVGL